MLPLLFAAVAASAQTEVLNAPLKDFTPVGAITDSPSGYSDWTFEKCAVSKDLDERYDDSWLQVGTNSGNGRLTTPALSALEGNALVTLFACPLEDNVELGYETNEGKLNIDHSLLPSKGSWYRLSPFLLRG